MYLPDWAKAMVEYDYNRDHNIVNTSYDGGYSIYNYFETIEEMKKVLSFTNYLKEEELEKILDVCQERISKKTENEEAKRNFDYTIRTIVQRRHCSEDFLLKYLDKLRRFDIIEKHEKEITTREYSSLVRELELKEKYSRIKGYLD